MGAKLFRADGQTDMTKLMVAFRNFANAPNKTEHINQGSMLGTEDGTRIGVEKPLCDNRNAVYKGGWITEHICWGTATVHQNVGTQLSGQIDRPKLDSATPRPSNTDTLTPGFC